VDLRSSFDEGELKAQAAELVERGLLEKDDVALIDWGGVVAFWTSPEGTEICARCADVRRELPFTFKLGNDDLAQLGLNNVLPVPEGEFILTQGVADLVVLGAKEIWLIDFKTDAVKAKDARAKAAEYRAQISLYALALERIYQKPVTRRGLYFLGARQLEWMQ
jgi:ATP-dependent helicase/nuclease subunit A